MFWPTQAFNVYGHDPVGVGLRGIPIGFSILAGACIVLWLLSVLRGHNKELMIVSSILMTAGCGAISIARVDNLHQLWGILVVAGLGIGGIVVPASIITTIICPDDLIATVAALTLAIRVIGGSIGYCVYCESLLLCQIICLLPKNCANDGPIRQCLHQQIRTSRYLLYWRDYGTEAEHYFRRAHW